MHSFNEMREMQLVISRGNEIRTNPQVYVRTHGLHLKKKNIQYNLDGSNTDGSFNVDDSNSFFSPYTILPITQVNKYLGIFFIMELYVVCTH